jgi:aminoglycoside phosphotransferase (APT) family kinase protein
VPASPMPPAEVDIDTDLVRRLVASQFPELAAQDIRPLASGWDNESFRLGDELTVRLPRRTMAAALVENEATWLPRLAADLPLAVPTPVHLGRPGDGYPWPWTICRWVPGHPLDVEPPVDPHDAATQLGSFVRALHRPAPAEAPRSAYRGTPLVDRDTPLRDRLAQLRGLVDVLALGRLWDDALAAPVHQGAPVWIHGDLHPLNVVASEGRLSGVIDFGDICAGDPATDLSAAWILLPARARQDFRDAAGPEAADDATWARARGWAVSHGVMCLASSADNPRIGAIGRRTIDAVLGDDG